MKRSIAPARALLLIAAVLAVGALVVAFALTGRPAPHAAPQPAAPAVDSQGPSTPGPAATSPAAGPVPNTRTPPAPATSEPAEEPADPTSPPTADQVAVDAAVAFAAAWLNADDPQWADKLAARSTPELAALWPTADPTTVPAGRVGDSRTIHSQLPSDVLADVAIPVVTSKGGPVGLLTLELTLTGGRWLVSDVDWSRA